ncbi:MAG: dienelactone hydrolase family protein [Burkholderiaceae bacterium]|nr:dienelactone hydrolase family protein [Burkholderiaceae bacterium]
MELKFKYINSGMQLLILSFSLFLAFLARPGWAESILISTPTDFHLQAQWFKSSNTRKPAIIALHGCSGLYRADGKTLQSRYQEYVERLNLAGYHVLLPDSFRSRGSSSICSIRYSARDIDIEDRREDVLAALEWLHQQPEVDPKRIALLGWSHGAMTVLSTLNARRPFYPQGLAGAVVFYPGCRESLQNEILVQTPLLIELAENDDWTAPGPCIELARRLNQLGAPVSLRVYANSYHGFDGSAPVRFRSDIPNGIFAQGIHVGGNPLAREQALADLDAFFRHIFH